VDDPQAVGGGGRSEIALIDERDRKATQGRIPRRAGSVDARSYDEEIKPGIAKLR
jgi:hypothetical protein